MKPYALILFIFCTLTSNTINAMWTTCNTSENEESDRIAQLHKAASKGDFFEIERMENQVDVNAKNSEGNTALHLIVLASDKDLQAFLKKDYSYRYLVSEDYPRKKIKIVRKLLAMGAQKKVINNAYQTPFDCLESFPETEDYAELRKLLDPSQN